MAVLTLQLFSGESKWEDVIWASVQAIESVGDWLLWSWVHGQQGLHLLAGQGQAHEPAGNSTSTSTSTNAIISIVNLPTKVGMPGGVDPVLRFMVKFYMPDPSQLEEEYTRYGDIYNLDDGYGSDVDDDYYDGDDDYDDLYHLVQVPLLTADQTRLGLRPIAGGTENKH